MPANITLSVLQLVTQLCSIPVLHRHSADSVLEPLPLNWPCQHSANILHAAVSAILPIVALLLLSPMSCSVCCAGMANMGAAAAASSAGALCYPCHKCGQCGNLYCSLPVQSRLRPPFFLLQKKTAPDSTTYNTFPNLCVIIWLATCAAGCSELTGNNLQLHLQSPIHCCPCEDQRTILSNSLHSSH